MSRETLASGMELILAPRRDAPLVDVELIVLAGAEHNPLDRAGLASLVASLVDEGSRRRSGIELANALERLGIALEAGADWDCAHVSAASLAEHFETALEAVAEVAHEATFPADQVERLRAQTLAEIDRRPDQPAVVAAAALAAELYPDTPFADLLQGSSAGVTAISRDEIVAFHARHYLASPAYLVVGGGFDAATVRIAADRLFARSRARAAEAGGEPVNARAERVVRVVDLPHAAQTELRVGHAGVARTDPDRTRLGVLNGILGGKFSSRLNLNLRERRGITYGVSSRFVDRKSPGPFVVTTAVATESTGAAAGEILAELTRLREEPVSESELRETRDYLLGVFPYTFQTNASHVGRLADLALFRLPDDHFERALEEIRSTSVEEIRRLARAHLRPDDATIVAVGPAERLVPQLESFGRLVVTGVA